MKSLCLVMMVKNESAVIRRCLDSVTGLIDHWVVCDTGSEDQTKEIVRDALKGIPGELYESPWKDFGSNRSEVLRLARGKADYHLLIDADMVLNAGAPFKDLLTADAYLVRCEGPCDYYVPRIVSDQHEWRYEGVTHEFIRSDTAKTFEKIAALSVRHFSDGGSRSDKYQRDIELLKRGLEQDANNSRYVFYLAQSYRDAGNLPQALEWYEKRAAMGGWPEEVWSALYQVARCQQMLRVAWPLVLPRYLAAYEFRPTRIEPLFQVAKFYRELEQYHLGYLYARAAMEVSYPEDILFIERSVYEYELPLEYAICCYWIGKHEEAIRVNDRVLAQSDVPESFRETARKNREFSLSKR